MTEQTLTPTITGTDGEVIIDLPGAAYLRMPAEMANKFATAILQAAAKAEGKPAHMFIIPVTEDRP